MLQIPDDTGYESAHEHACNEKVDYISDASTSSEPVPKKNKRKAYVPRGACSVLVPAGVDLFEPEYDPLMSIASGTPNTYSKEKMAHFYPTAGLCKLTRPIFIQQVASVK